MLKVMRKPVVPRFLLLLVLYAVLFILLVQFQFSKRTDFTRRTGDLVIQGSYGEGEPGKTMLPNSYSLSGAVSVFFGGIEFLMGDGLTLAGSGGTVTPHPRIMVIADNEVYFQFAEGPKLIFSTQYTGGAIELVIRIDLESFPDGFSSLELPYRPLATSLVQGNGSSFMLNAGGTNYSFTRPVGSGAIYMETASPTISYRAIPDRQTLSPGDFILPAALNVQEYEASFALWLDQAYLGWNRTVSQNAVLPAEVPGAQLVEATTAELVSAYMNEALKRGTYKAAAAVSAAYNNTASPSYSYEASVYVNRLDAALRSLSVAERERSARFARLFNEKSPDFLREFHIIEYLGIRSYSNLMDDAAEILRTFDPSGMTAVQTAGFLEGHLDWNRYQSGSYNPYERFIDQALFVITGSLQKNPRTGHSLVFTGEEADTELNLRLGSALMQYDDETRIALGRTLILSVLSLADNTGAVPRIVVQDAVGNFSGRTSSPLLGSQRIYRFCGAGEFYARAHAVDAGVWAWTAASPVSGTALPGRLDVAVNFPAGETHYMLIRGVRPFTRIQFNNVNFVSDPQFERYDSSGWSYSPSEQTLLIKIRHRLPTERISIIY
jgi:hypothetical protein